MVRPIRNGFLAKGKIKIELNMLFIIYQLYKINSIKNLMGRKENNY